MIRKKIRRALRSVRYATGYEAYSENAYGKNARLTSQAYRDRLTGWQVPAIKTHFGDLTGKVFLDIGAGDIVLGEKLAEIGIPSTFYVQDLSQPSLDAGLRRIRASDCPQTDIVTLCSDDFDFGMIPDATVDFAFSNSLFSHLSINSIVLCLGNLAPKMRPGSKYLSSMIVLPTGDGSAPHDWHQQNVKGSDVTSYPNRDPFHYTETTVRLLSSFDTGFTVKTIHDYGHPFQKLVEFARV